MVAYLVLQSMLLMEGVVVVSILALGLGDLSTILF